MDSKYQDKQADCHCNLLNQWSTVKNWSPVTVVNPDNESRERDISLFREAGRESGAASEPRRCTLSREEADQRVCWEVSFRLLWVRVDKLKRNKLETSWCSSELFVNYSCKQVNKAQWHSASTWPSLAALGGSENTDACASVWEDVCICVCVSAQMCANLGLCV